MTVQQFELPLLGVNSDQSVLTMAAGNAPTLRNFLLHEGHLHVRGPIETHASLSISTSGSQLVAGAWYFGNNMLLSTVAPHPTHVHEPWTLGFRPSSANNCAIPTNQHELIDTSALTETAIVVGGGTTAKIIGGRGARLGAYTYGLGYADDSVNIALSPSFWPALNGMRARQFLRWDGSSTDPTAYTNAPTNGQDVIAHSNRVWVLGGTPPGGGAFSPNSLFYSDQAGPTADTSAMWQDDATGLVNQIVVDSTDTNDSGVALARLGQTLAIFKRHSLHVMSGYGTTTFNVRPFSQDVGCIDQRSIVEFEDAVYFMSERGYYRFDGTKLEMVAPVLRTSLIAGANAAVGQAGVDGARVQATKLSNDYILVIISNQTVIAGNTQGTGTAYLLHTPTSAWTTFTLGASDIPNAIGTTPAGIPWALYGARIFKITNVTSPERVSAAVLGYDALASNTPINASWLSRAYQSSEYTKNIQLQKFLLDYKYLNRGGAAPGAGWACSVFGGTSPTALQTGTTAASATATQYSRYVLDVFNETDDVQISASTDTSVTNGNADQHIYAAGVEHQTSNPRHTLV